MISFIHSKIFFDIRYVSSTINDTGDMAINKPNRSPTPPGVYNLAGEARNKPIKHMGCGGVCDTSSGELESRGGDKEGLVRAGLFGIDTQRRRGREPGRYLDEPREAKQLALGRTVSNWSQPQNWNPQPQGQAAIPVS